MSDTSSDRIVRRALAPLPDLSSIVFFRKANRDFVTGDYRFMAPDGKIVDKRQHLQRFDFGRKELPQVGSKLLIIYVNAEAFEVL